MVDIELEENTDSALAFTFRIEEGMEVRTEAVADRDDPANPGIVMDVSFEGPVGGSGPMMLFNATIEGDINSPTETWTLFQVTMQFGIPPDGGQGEWVYEQDNIDTPLNELEEPALARIAKQAWDISHKEVVEWLLKQ